jgi:hypothetical protein
MDPGDLGGSMGSEPYIVTVTRKGQAMAALLCIGRVTRAGFVFVAVMSASACGSRASSGDEVARRLDQAIRAEVPVGAPRSQAEAWLIGRGILHEYLAGAPGDRSGQKSMPELAGLRDEDVAGTLRAMIACPDSKLGVSDSGQLKVYFFLDRQGASIGHLVHWFEYSL